MESRPLIKPLTKPSQPVMPDEKLLSRERAAKEAAAKAAAEAERAAKAAEIEAQKRAHSAFVEKLVNIDFRELEAMDDNQEEYLMDLIGFLLGWLSNHILASDKKIGKYIKEHNIVLEK
jgi:hemerythrin